MRQRKALNGFVFRNLHQEGVTYSVRNTEGITIFHTSGVLVKNAKFVVQPAGRDKVRSTKRKTVHAGVRGEIVTDPREAVLLNPQFSYPNLAYYNPYKCDTFVNVENKPIHEAKYVYLTSDNGKPMVLYIPM